MPRVAFRIVVATYMEYKSVLGSQSCAAFYRAMESGNTGTTGGAKIVRMSPLEFTVDVEKAAKRTLTSSEYFYFKKSILSLDYEFLEESRSALGEKRISELCRGISIAAGTEFLRSGIFPLHRYFAPIEGNHD